MEFWKLGNTDAQLTAEQFAARLSIASPTRGLTDATIANKSLQDCQLLEVVIPKTQGDAPPSESYVRGDDFIYKLPPRDSDQVRHEVYYTALEGPAGVELIVSAQTSLLESDPLTEVRSRFGPGELLVKTAADQACERVKSRIEIGADQPLYYAIYRPEGSDQSIVFFAHPTDFHRAVVETSPLSVSYFVFPDSLEKGVIRRAYFQMRVVPRDQEERLAEELVRNAAQMEPPLTA